MAASQVVPMDMLDLDKERELICDSMREARRNLKVRVRWRRMIAQPRRSYTERPRSLAHDSPPSRPLTTHDGP